MSKSPSLDAVVDSALIPLSKEEAVRYGWREGGTRARKVIAALSRIPSGNMKRAFDVAGSIVPCLLLIGRGSIYRGPERELLLGGALVGPWQI